MRGATIYSLLTPVAEKSLLNCALNFIQDCLCRFHGVAGLSDRPSNHQMACPGLDGLVRSANSLLIIVRASLRTDSGYDDTEAFAQQLAHRGNFPRRSNHALTSGSPGQRG